MSIDPYDHVICIKCYYRDLLVKMLKFAFLGVYGYTPYHHGLQQCLILGWPWNLVLNRNMLVCKVFWGQCCLSWLSVWLGSIPGAQLVLGCPYPHCSWCTPMLVLGGWWCRSLIRGGLGVLWLCLPFSGHWVVLCKLALLLSFPVVYYSLVGRVFFNVGSWVWVFKNAELVLTCKLLWRYFLSSLWGRVCGSWFSWLFSVDYLPWVVRFEGFPFIGTCSAIFF